MHSAPKVSIIIPTYNEEATIRCTLRHLNRHFTTSEIIVVDGQSSDQTRKFVRANFPEVTLISSSERGRAIQMNKGAQEATGDLLFFLHADTLPPAGSLLQMQQLFQDERVTGASFRLEFDEKSWPYRLLAYFSRWNTLFTTYGDQGLLVRKSTFDALGGFPEIPIFEDLELQRKLRRAGRFVKIPRPVTTAARRFKERGLLRQLLLNAVLVLAWRMGRSPEKLARFYSYHG